MAKKVFRNPPNLFIQSNNLKPIAQSHKTHNALVTYPTTQHSQTCAHNYSEWCIVGYWCIVRYARLVFVMPTSRGPRGVTWTTNSIIHPNGAHQRETTALLYWYHHFQVLGVWDITKFIEFYKCNLWARVIKWSRIKWLRITLPGYVQIKTIFHYTLILIWCHIFVR